jgi:hypothetical protein
MRLKGDDEVVEMVVVKRGTELLSVAEYGFGKRTRISEFRNTGRGGQGVKCMDTGERNGALVSVKEVVGDDEVMMITKMGMIIRCPMEGISIVGRTAKGVKLINLKEGDAVVDVALVASDEKAEEIEEAQKTAVPQQASLPGMEEVAVESRSDEDEAQEVAVAVEQTEGAPAGSKTKRKKKAGEAVKKSRKAALKKGRPAATKKAKAKAKPKAKKAKPKTKTKVKAKKAKAKPKTKTKKAKTKPKAKKTAKKKPASKKAKKKVKAARGRKRR